MAEERADALIQLWADDVLELAGLRMHFGFVDGKSILEEALREAMASDNVSRASASHWSELRFPILKVDKMQIRHAAQNLRGWLFRTKRETSRSPGRVEAGYFGWLPFLSADPDLLEEMIEANLVIGGNRSAAIGGVGERARQRMARAVLGSIKVEAAVGELNAPIGLPRDVRVVRDHQNRVACVVQLTKDFQNDFFIRFIEVARGLVGQDDFRLIDQRARDGHALLFAAGELRREMRHALAQADAAQGLLGLLLIRHTVKVLRQHHVLDRA
jgi:hypothetical protein